MRTLFGLTLYIILPFIVNGQDISKKLFLTNESDTVFWKKLQDNCFSKIKQIQPFNEKQDYHFRIVYHGQTISNSIDLWKEKNSNYNLEIQLYTKEYVPYDDEEQTNRYYSEKTKYDSIFSAEVLKLISISQIDSIPTDKRIKGWSRGFDGIEIIIETLNDKKYSFKQYWTPSAQDTLKEGLVINNFIKELRNLLELRTKEKEFSTRIPFESYNTGGPATAVRALTKKERRLYKKERKNYRQQLLKPNGVDA